MRSATGNLVQAAMDTPAARRSIGIVLLTWALGASAVLSILLVRSAFWPDSTRLGVATALSVLFLTEGAVTLLRWAVRHDVVDDAMRRGVERSATAAAWLGIAWISLASASWWGVLLSWPWFLAIESAWWSRMTPWRIASPTAERRVERDARLPVEPDRPAGGEKVEQACRRVRQEDGATRITGILHTELAPGQRLEPLHVVFCPPLEERPELSATLIEGPAADVRITDVECYGARIELRRSARSATGAESFTVAWEAVSASALPSHRECRSK